MKQYYKILTITVLLLTTYCTSRDNLVEKDNLMGNDYRLFQGTPAWELAKAVWDEDTNQINEIIKHDTVNIDFQEPKFGQTLLMLAVKNGHYNSVKALLSAGADPNVHDKYDGSSALIDASGHNSYSENKGVLIMNLLLEHGANPNDEEVGPRRDGNTRRDTPLLNASGESLEKVTLLVSNGADVNYINDFGVTPLSRSFLQDKYDITLFLLKNGADYEVPIVRRGNKDLFLVDMLRELMLPIDSDKYKQKMKIVSFLESRGINYHNHPIPDFVVDEAKENYPREWQEYLKEY